MANEIKIEIHINELKKAFDESAEKALTLCGAEAEGDAKIEIESHPRRVDTGRLRNSITWATKKEHSRVDPKLEKPNKDASDADGLTSSQAEDRAVIIGTNVEYAARIHEGDESTGLDPNRFLRNAVERNANKYKGIIDDTLRGQLTSG